MKRTEKLNQGIFGIVLMLLLSVAILSGCVGGDGNDDSDPANSDLTEVDPGPPVAEFSAITVNPSTIPADGVSTAVVRVTLANSDAGPVPDGTEVLLYATMGTITSENPVKTTGGRAEFTLQAPEFTGMGVLSLPDYPDISAVEIVYGSIGYGIPASIRVESVSPQEIAVTGVGEPDNAAVRLRVLDETGTEIEGSGYRIRARMLTMPHGGERFAGASDYEILIPIIQGASSFNIQSGTLPGAVEIEVEVLDTDGKSLNPAVKTLIQRISIASGPPHMVFLSTSIPPKVIDLVDPKDSGLPQTPGFYCQYAGISVNDRWGNPVPDGTIVNIGVLDTVIASGKCNISGNVLTVTNLETSDPVLRGGESRNIEHGDRVIIESAIIANKSRFIDEVGRDELGNLSWIKVTEPYVGEEIGHNFLVGASLLGSSVHGINEDGPAKGTVITQEGLGQIRFVYPSYVVGQYEGDPSMRIISVITISEYNDDFYGYSPDNCRFVLFRLDEGTLGFYNLSGQIPEQTD